MRNTTYVCTSCRTAKRAKPTGGLITNYRCSLCSNPLSELSKRWRIPRKDDDKGWKEVQALVLSNYQQWSPRRTQTGIEKIKKIDVTISTLERKPTNPIKERQLKKLRFERQVKKKAYNLEGVI